jgi:hypothetical protein
MRTSLATILITLTSFAPTAQARAESPVEVSLFSGVSLLDVGRDVEVVVQCFAAPCPPIRQRRAIGHSFMDGGGVGLRIARPIVLEGSLSLATSHHVVQDAERFEDPLVAYHFDGGLRYETTAIGLRPFVSMGGGYIRYGTGRLPASERDDWSLNLGAGASLRLAERVRARFEIVDHVVTDHAVTHGTAHDVHVRIGATLLP